MSQITKLFDGTVKPNTETLTGDVGGAVGPDAALNINLLTGAGLTSTGVPGTNTITFAADQATTAALGSVTLATSTETLVATDSSKVVTPATLNSQLSEMVMTGFRSWGGVGAYFDDTTLGTFQLLRGGTGFIKGKLVTWVPQSYVGMVAGNTYFIYIDSTGTIGASTSHLDSDYENYIMLFECLRDSTPVTNNQLTVREDHPYSFQTGPSNYLHDVVGPVIENVVNGANIALNGTQGIQINGTDYLQDHGLRTTISDSAGAAVTFVRMYTTAAGKWARQNATTTFTGYWNNAGTATALTAGRYGVYTLYVSKDNLNSSTPVYIAVLNTAQYTSQSSAQTAIANGSTSKASGEIAALEIAQLGYIIYRESIASIVQVIISKTTLRATLSTSGTNQASLVNTNVTNFDGWLSAADTNVQAALETMDDVLKGGTAGQLVASNGAATMPTYTTATYPTTTAQGDLLSSTANNTVVALSKDANATRYLSNTGANNNAAWAQVALATGVSGTLPVANGGTGVAAIPSFSAYKSASTANVTGSNATYSYVCDTEHFDIGGNYNAGTGIFTAPYTGKYFFTASVYLNGCTLASAMYFNLVCTGYTLTRAFMRTASSADFTSSFSGVVSLAAGETCYPTVLAQGEAANTDDLYGAAGVNYTSFSGFWVGP